MSYYDGTVTQDNSPAQQEAALDRLKFMLSQLPWGAAGPESEIEPTGIADSPHVIDLVQERLVWRAQKIQTRIDFLRNALSVLTTMGMPVPPEFQEAVKGIVNDILDLQRTLQ